MKEITELAEKKNQWLYSQVDVAYPTAESIKGKNLYKERCESCLYTPLQQAATDKPLEAEIHKVDFHRLTVMFAQLQAAQFQSGNQEGEESAWILEFFAQIIFSELHDIYLGFAEQRLIFGAIVTKEDNLVLVSDIAKGAEDINDQQVTNCLVQYLNLDTDQPDIWFSRNE